MKQLHWVIHCGEQRERGWGDKVTPQGWGSPRGPRSPGLQGMGWMGSANWESGATGRGWWLGVKAGIMT